MIDFYKSNDCFVEYLYKWLYEYMSQNPVNSRSRKVDEEWMGGLRK